MVSPRSRRLEHNTRKMFKFFKFKFTLPCFHTDVDIADEQGREVLPGSSPHMTTPEAEVLSRLTDVLSLHNSPGNGAAVVRELKLLLPELERLEGPPCHQAQLTLDRFVL